MSPTWLRLIVVALVAVLTGLYVVDAARVQADSTDTKLARCKAKLLQQFDAVAATDKTGAMKGFRSMAELSVAKLTGDAGLVECEAAVIRNEAKR